MRTWVKIGRYHLAQPTLFAMPWWNLAFAFVVCVIIFSQIPVSHHEVMTAHGLASVPDWDRWTGALTSLLGSVFAVGVASVGRLLPFGLTLGASRRSYYTGTALVGMAFAAVSAVAVTALQAIERATDGWGVAMKFFQVPYLMAGPWYLTWLTSFVVLSVLFVYGMWFGIVYHRWGLSGIMAFLIAQVTVALAGALTVTWAHAWPNVGGFFTALTALGLTGVLAALTAVLLAGGHATIRRVTV